LAVTGDGESLNPGSRPAQGHGNIAGLEGLRHGWRSGTVLPLCPALTRTDEGRLILVLAMPHAETRRITKLCPSRLLVPSDGDPAQRLRGS